MSLRFKHYYAESADLDVTSFMNLMIVLVPVLLLSLTFSQITAHEIRLPDLSQSEVSSEQSPPKLEVVLGVNDIKIYYPSNQLVQTIEKIKVPQSENDETQTVAEFDYQRLSLVMQAIKQQIPDKRDILLLSESAVNYQHLIFAMDSVKSYKTVIATDVVEVELFPEISLANASVK